MLLKMLTIIGLSISSIYAYSQAQNGLHKSNNKAILNMIPVDPGGDPGIPSPGGSVIQAPTYTSFTVTDTNGNTNTLYQFTNGDHTTVISTPAGQSATYAYQNQQGQESVLINGQYRLTWVLSGSDISALWINNIELGYKDINGTWITNPSGLNIWQNCKSTIPQNVINASTSISNYLAPNQDLVIGQFALPMRSRWGCGWAVFEYIWGWGAILTCPETFGIGCAVGLAIHVHSGVGIATNCS